MSAGAERNKEDGEILNTVLKKGPNSNLFSSIEATVTAVGVATTIPQNVAIVMRNVTTVEKSDTYSVYVRVTKNSG